MKLVSLIVVLALTGCTMTVSPDGTREYRTEPETFLRAIEVLGQK
jgi:hypothetical protein